MKKGGASCGLGFNSVPDIHSSLQVATANGYDFMVSYIYILGHDERIIFLFPLKKF